MLIANPEFYGCTKYIEVQYYYIENVFDYKKLVTNYLFTKNKVAVGLNQTLDLKFLKKFMPDEKTLN